MRKLMACLVALVATSAANAAVINFDSFSDGQNLHGVNLGGVTLTAPNGVVEVYANNRFGVGFHTPLNAIGSFTSNQSNNPLVGVFSAPVSFVQLFGGDGGGDIDSWRLDAYDAVVGGTLLGSVNSGNFNGNPYIGLSISASGIRRFEAVWTGNAAGVGYDTLTFNLQEVPEPVSLVVFGTLLVGGAGVALRRRMTAKATA